MLNVITFSFIYAELNLFWVLLLWVLLCWVLFLLNVVFNDECCLSAIKLSGIVVNVVAPFFYFKFIWTPMYYNT